MKFTIFQNSRQGPRQYNQDRLAYSYSKDALLLVVADGMGGHRHGNGSQGGNPNRGTPAALDDARRPAVTLTGRRPGDIKPAALFGPRGGGNSGNGGNNR